MIWRLLFSATVPGLLVSAAMLAMRHALRCPQCGEVHDDPLDDCQNGPGKTQDNAGSNPVAHAGRPERGGRRRRSERQYMGSYSYDNGATYEHDFRHRALPPNGDRAYEKVPALAGDFGED